MRSAAPAPLPVIALPGLRADVLGGYMAAVGLLRVASRKWPSVRGAWRDGSFVLVGGPGAAADLVGHLIDVARAGDWSSYERFWKKEQEKKDPRALARLAAQRSEEEARLLAAHIVPGTRLWFNPLLGTGGNAGKRSFSKGWATARDDLRQALGAASQQQRSARAKGRGRRGGAAAAGPETPGSPAPVEQDLLGFLGGGDCVLEKDWGAGSWFSQAVETANSGQTPTSKGQVSPWAMLLACEALPMFAGSPSRRLGSRARASAAFPFATGGPAPGTEGEAGKARGELWLPLWERPMTIPELRWLYWRARAEVGSRGATTPAAFSAAVLRRGTDAGLSGFARFTLASTTGQTFEPRFDGIVATARRSSIAGAGVEGRVAETVLGLFDQLPRDQKVGKRWRVSGYRAPLERALTARAADPTSPATARVLADALVHVLDRADRSQAVRKRGLRWRLLPCEWLSELFGNEAPLLEARLAMAVASLLPTGEVPAFAAYRFGIELEASFALHPRQPPARWVWRVRDVEQGLVALARRRLVDAASADGGASARSLPFWAAVRVPLSDVGDWLRRDLDEALLGRWISRMALLDWRGFRRAAEENERLRNLTRPANTVTAIEGDLALYGLLRPLIDPRTIVAQDGEPLLAEDSGARTVGAARYLAAVLATGATTAALDHARRRYAMGMRPLVDIAAPFAVTGPRRLLASLVFGVPGSSLARVAERFLRPARNDRKERMA